MQLKSFVMSALLVAGLVAGCGGLEEDAESRGEPAAGEVQAQDISACEQNCFNAFRVCTYDATTPEDGEACAQELADCRYGPTGCNPL